MHHKIKAKGYPYQCTIHDVFIQDFKEKANHGVCGVQQKLPYGVSTYLVEGAQPQCEHDATLIYQYETRSTIQSIFDNKSMKARKGGSH